MAIALGLTAPGAFCAIWLVLPPPNRALWLAAFVARESAPRVYRLASPINHAAPDNPPTLLVQGADDRLQSPVDTVMLADRLSQEGVEHELVWLQHAGHAFHGSWGGFASQITRPLLLGFLDRHVGAPE